MANPNRSRFRMNHAASAQAPKRNVLSRGAGVLAVVAGLGALFAVARTSMHEPPVASEATATRRAAPPARELRRRYARHAAAVLDSGNPVQALRAGFLVALREAEAEAARPSAMPPARALQEELALHPNRPAGVSAHVELPADGADATTFHIGDRRVASIREDGAYGPAETVGNAVSYARRGGRVYWSADARGAEEWLELDAGQARAGNEVARWTVEGGTLRMHEGKVLVDDADGVPMIVASAPEAYTQSGRAVSARLGIDGNAVTLEVDAGGEAVLVDPAWSLAGLMTVARSDHTETVLQNGKILVTGGYDSTTFLSSAELYDPAANTWTATGSMATARYLHTATLLNDGRVLIVGGWDGVGTVASVEIYDPAAGTFSTATPMAAKRYWHTATLLQDGTVLVAGGADDAGNGLATAERYNPTAGTWTSGIPLKVGRYLHTATMLTSGKVLLVGGYMATAGTNSTELFNPTGNTFTTSGAMSVIRYYHTATALNGVTILVAGGKRTGVQGVNTAEIFANATKTFTATGNLVGARYYHTASLLSTGHVVLAGGYYNGTTLGTTENYDPAAGTFSSAGTLPTSVGEHRASVLNGTTVLVSGGYDPVALARTRNSQRFGGLANGQTCSAAEDCSSGFCSDGVCCNVDCGASTADCQACSVAAGATTDGTCAPLPNTTVCRTASQMCDVAETCDGTSAACPADGVLAANTVCRASVALCDAPEVCDGASKSCPANAWYPAGYVCRAVNGLCDIAETCSGTSKSCPADGYAPSGTVCNAANGLCDVAETCSGTSRSCPTNVFLPAGTLCRASAGVCDADEYCSGTSRSCPANSYAPSSQVCRAAVDVCDVAESCTGSSKACPTDAFQPAYTPCGSPNVCDGLDRCVTPLADGGLPKELLGLPRDAGSDGGDGDGGETPSAPHGRSGLHCGVTASTGTSGSLAGLSVVGLACLGLSRRRRRS